MNVYIVSVLTKEKINKQDELKILNRIRKLYPNKIETNNYKYEDRVFYELDFDIRDIAFNKETIQDEILKIIEIFDLIFKIVREDCDIIGGYNDTENAIMFYEKNRDEHYKKFNLFATKKPFIGGSPYFISEDFTVYQSFEYDSMGIIF